MSIWFSLLCTPLTTVAFISGSHGLIGPSTMTPIARGVTICDCSRTGSGIFTPSPSSASTKRGLPSIALTSAWASSHVDITAIKRLRRARYASRVSSSMASSRLPLK
ncbi:hypothetical protein T484DRAFT_1988256 [Baffinella frigidus]|nr:hypothetical protein T484DRAFT_1988256 [Cryptophyta sp. CCMP2293]